MGLACSDWARFARRRGEAPRLQKTRSRQNFTRTGRLDVFVGGPPRGDAGRKASQCQWALRYPTEPETKARFARRRGEAPLLQKARSRQNFTRTGRLDVFVGGPPRGDAGRRTANVSGH